MAKAQSNMKGRRNEKDAIKVKELFKPSFEFKYAKPISYRAMEKDHGDLLASDDVSLIERWSDYSFTTSDGRTFGIFLHGDTIEHKLQAAHVLVTKYDKARLAKTAGFIIEVGSGERPFVFEDWDALVRAWVEYHEAFGVPLAEVELETGIFPVDGEEREEA